MLRRIYLFLVSYWSFYFCVVLRVFFSEGLSLGVGLRLFLVPGVDLIEARLIAVAADKVNNYFLPRITRINRMAETVLSVEPMEHALSPLSPEIVERSFEKS